MKPPSRFKTQFAEHIFRLKYALGEADSWDSLARRVVDHVCGTADGTLHPIMGEGDRKQLTQYIAEMKFIPGGRYLYYAGRPARFFNNCYLLRAEEDTREEWSAVAQRAMSCLMTGGGIGVDYSILRPAGHMLKRTGGKASGPLPLMHTVNEIGRNVMQGGSRRSAIYASLNWRHEDAPEFLIAKNWKAMPVGKAVSNTDPLLKVPYTLSHAKQDDFNFPAPLDMTNISLNYDDVFLAAIEDGKLPKMFLDNCRQAMQTGEPGFSFNFGRQQNETLRNAPVSADTHVLTDKGYVQIGEIVGIPVSIWTGQKWAVDVTFLKSKSDAPTVVVKMTGGREIKADPSHEFLVERYEGAGKERRKMVAIERIPAGDLQEGDILLTSLPAPPRRQNSEAYVYGFTYGDGSFVKRYDSRAEITFCTDEKKQCFESMNYPFGSVNRNDARGFVRAYLVDEWFRGKSKAVFPNLHPGQVASFLAGVFDADGSYDASQHRIRLSSIHLGFLEGARRALETLGIQAGITTGGLSGYSGTLGYLLVVYGSSVSRFLEAVPTVRIKPETYTPYRATTIKVLSVEPGPVEDVYCCDVGVPEHSFCAEGVIISNCTEVTSEDDSDVCNLGSINLGAIGSIEELKDVICLGQKFLVCGTVRAELPYEKVYKVREKNRRLGLGLMGVHEWLLKKGAAYEVTPELQDWLAVYRDESKRAADAHCERLYLSQPVAYRAIAPTGSIGILASTTTGIEPLFAVAYKRRYLTNDARWKYEFVVDSTADHLIKEHAIDPAKIQTAYSLAGDYERRIKFQADVQDYVDMSISSTINLPRWGTDDNNEDRVAAFATILAAYAPRLRGFTCYPDGSRGGQPITEVAYSEAIQHKGVVYEENDICEIGGKGGTCGS